MRFSNWSFTGGGGWGASTTSGATSGVAVGVISGVDVGAVLDFDACAVGVDALVGPDFCATGEHAVSTIVSRAIAMNLIFTATPLSIVAI